jgi:hypothetical protein
MTDITRGTRVSYTVAYGGKPGYPQLRTEFGKVTRVRPGGSRNEPRATIAVGSPRPGSARYVERYVSDIRALGTQCVYCGATGALEPINPQGSQACQYVTLCQLRRDGWDPVRVATDISRALAKDVANLSTYELASLVTVLKATVAAAEVELGNYRPRANADEALSQAQRDHAPRH